MKLEFSAMPCKENEAVLQSTMARELDMGGAAPQDRSPEGKDLAQARVCLEPMSVNAIKQLLA